ncbi:hypothetical protein Hanom_Chr06g00575621 [Helianthus anomalus]
MCRLDTLVTLEVRHASHDVVILPNVILVAKMMMGRWFQRKMNPGRDCEVEEEALTREEQ